MAKTLDAVKKYTTNDKQSIVPTSRGQGIIVTDAPSVTALKVADVLIKSCGGRLADESWHEINAYDLKLVKGIKHHSAHMFQLVDLSFYVFFLNFD